MEFFTGTKTQISPCISAKAKYALNLTNEKPSNTKRCSYEYWCKVIETISTNKNLTTKVAENAKNKFKSLIK
jgi:hypothetical protein